LCDRNGVAMKIPPDLNSASGENLELDLMLNSVSNRSFSFLAIYFCELCDSML
jgi:hypothetical protein